MSSEPALCGGDAELSSTEHGEHIPPITPEKNSARTLLWEAVTHRPLEEVAALVELLKRSGDVPNPGDEALRVAVVSRPVSEVAALFELLQAAPHTAESSHEALRAAAVGRSVEEVAQLIELFDRTKDGGPGPYDHDSYDTDPYGTSGPFPPGPGGPGGPVEPEPTRTMPVGLDPDVRPLGTAAQAAAASRGESMAHQPPPNRPPWAQRPDGTMPHGGPPWGAPSEASQQPGYAVPGVLRSVLRWPAAAALALCGLSHLPVNASHMQGAQAAAGLSMAIAVIYLLLAGWLAMRDTALVWTVSAAAAMVIIALHALSRSGVLAPLGSGLGDAGMWPELMAVGLAIVSAGLAGAALLFRPRRVGPAAAGV
ncbi:hypothetical protein [Streptomyces inhibens]|uniref:hypothetical protein n=1 Tax=Streptomyces inhibens TaxID=2293571 RepID=UPI001EE73FAE|nr:hypothetical protein [Streptomyces inhibens]UKY48366.1 hypothetical protein KI385_05825 [Streptomyces inhibens]